MNEGYPLHVVLLRWNLFITSKHSGLSQTFLYCTSLCSIQSHLIFKINSLSVYRQLHFSNLIAFFIIFNINDALHQRHTTVKEEEEPDSALLIIIISKCLSEYAI